MKRWNGGPARYVVANLAALVVSLAIAGAALALPILIAQSLWLALDLRRPRGIPAAPLWAVALAGILVASCAPARQVKAVPSGQIYCGGASADCDRVGRVTARIAIANELLCRDHPIGVMLLPGSTRTGCALSVAVVPSPAVNAFTDSAQIMITTGMLGAIDSDDELAAVIGHELGHILRDHVQTTRRNAGVGKIADAVIATQGVNTGGAFELVGSRVMNPRREYAADRVGIYIAARAGFRPEAAAEFWSRMPDRFEILASHPMSSDRADDARKIAGEVAEKMARNLELLPE